MFLPRIKKKNNNLKGNCNFSQSLISDRKKNLAILRSKKIEFWAINRIAWYVFYLYLFIFMRVYVTQFCLYLTIWAFLRIVSLYLMIFSTHHPQVLLFLTILSSYLIGEIQTQNYIKSELWDKTFHKCEMYWSEDSSIIKSKNQADRIFTIFNFMISL